MSYSFPKNSEDGEEVTLDNGVTYRFNSLKKSWEVLNSGSTSGGMSLHSVSHSAPKTVYGSSATYLDTSRPKSEIYTVGGDPKRSQLNSTSEVGMFSSNSSYSGDSMSVKDWSTENTARYFWFHPSHMDLTDALIGDSLVLEASNGSKFVATVRGVPQRDSWTGWTSIYIIRWNVQGPSDPGFTDGDTELKVYLADERLNSKDHTHVPARIAGWDDRYLRKWKSLAANEFAITDSTAVSPSTTANVPAYFRYLKQIKLYAGMTGSLYEGGHDIIETNNFGFISISAPTGGSYRPSDAEFKEYNQWSEYARTNRRVPLYLGMTASAQRSNSSDKTFHMFSMNLSDMETSHSSTEGYVYSVKHIGIIDGRATPSGYHLDTYAELSDESDYLTADQMENAVEEAGEMAKDNPEDKNLERIKEDFRTLYGTQN